MQTIHLTDKITTGETHVFQSADRPAAANKRLCIVNHGVGQSSLVSAMSASRYAFLFDQITRAGLHVLHIDGGVAVNWGNDTAIAAMGNAWTWAKANLPVKTDQFVSLAFSHGLTLALNYAKANPSQVRGLASIIGVVDTQDIHDNNRGSLAAGIEAAAGTPTALTDAGTVGNALSFVSPATALSSSDVGASLTGSGIPAGTTITGVASTTIAAGSNGAALPQATINVASTTGFVNTGGGKAMVTTSAGVQVVSFTGSTSTTLTGCTGGTGTMSTGGAVVQAQLSTPPPATLAGASAQLWRPGTAIPDSWYAAHSPVRYAASMSGLVQKHWYSADDAVALPSALATYAAAVGANAVTEPFGTTGNGHSLGPGAYGAIPSSAIAAWLAALG